MWFYQATICHYLLTGIFFEKWCVDVKTRGRDGSGNPFAFLDFTRC